MGANFLAKISGTECEISEIELTVSETLID